MRLACYLYLILTILDASAWAEHPSNIQKKFESGEYLDALKLYVNLPKRQLTSEAMIAAGRSAWALSLPAMAIEKYEEVLKDENLPAVERARVYLSRGIIEFQEDRYEVAQLYAEKSAQLLGEAGPLRAKVWFLWGECLAKLGRYGAAEEKLLKALEEAPREEKGDMYYSLGSCQLKLGKNEDARVNLEKVPLRHDRTPHAIKLLAQIALEAKQFEQAEFWLAKGRSDFQESFLDSWVDYAMLQIALERKDITQAREVVERARKQYPPSDPWLTLLEGAFAQYSWQNQNAGNQ